MEGGREVAAAFGRLGAEAVIVADVVADDVVAAVGRVVFQADIRWVYQQDVHILLLL